MTKRGHHSSGHTNISENVLGPFNLIGQVKRTLVQALRLCTGLTVHKRSRGIALPFHDHGNRRGLGVSVTPRPLFYNRERPGTRCTIGWVGPRPSLDRCEKYRPPPPGLDPLTVEPLRSLLTTELLGPHITLDHSEISAE